MSFVQCADELAARRDGLRFRSVTMWKCRNCSLEVMPRSAEPKIDGDGVFFLCSGCKQRNDLVNVADDRDEYELDQPSVD